MPIYLYWGDDDFAISAAVTSLRDHFLDSAWESFNYDKIQPDQPDGLIFALNQAMTPPFGAGSRLVWLADTAICSSCPPAVIEELERTLPVIPSESVLLLTTRSKPDGRLKSTKLLQKYAGENFREFAAIPPWKTEDLIDRVREVAQQKQLRLTEMAVAVLAQSLGNNSRALDAELTKLQIYATGNGGRTLNEQDVNALVGGNTQNSLQLAEAIRDRKVQEAVGLVSDLIARNEPALRIVATLVGQFRLWLWVKMLLEAGEREDRIAQAVELRNPKRVYILKQEVRHLSTQKLLRVLPLLLELEVSLKRGAEDLPALQTAVIKLCQVLT
ncbi:DNA polymerase III subunit delta [Ancylothrix sp. C2]|uniref:DNA polymerase III subunit delta n=1 Tax=Ancylothrix sp. D3o TaxID=2953691 RepID=UPI0021BB7A2C|nr:DNA polymerase III subunit delta [Ancylothrix sp. D3o]MCT7951746.1 DNA polymerase III subunit delta [Ancylothrix sp. D3o]